jgi:hypothetical protein
MFSLQEALKALGKSTGYRPYVSGSIVVLMTYVMGPYGP